MESSSCERAPSGNLVKKCAFGSFLRPKILFVALKISKSTNKNPNIGLHSSIQETQVANIPAEGLQGYPVATIFGHSALVTLSWKTYVFREG